MRNILALIIILRAVATCTAATMATEGYVNTRVAAASAATTQHVATVAASLSNQITASVAALPPATILINPSNSNQWVSIGSNTMTIYTVGMASNLWAYHCGPNAVPDYPGVQWAPYPQDGTFTNAAPPLGSDGEIIAPMVGNSGGSFRFWWSSGNYNLSYPGDFPQVGATWSTNVFNGNGVDVYIRYLGEVAVTNTSILRIASEVDFLAHNIDTNAHAYIQARIASLPTHTDLNNTLASAQAYTQQYVLDTLSDADLATLTAVGIEIGNHNSSSTAHADIRASLTNLPPQLRLQLTNTHATNANARLVLTASNGVIIVQEVIP